MTKKLGNQNRSPYQTHLKGDVKVDIALPTWPAEYKKIHKKEKLMMFSINQQSINTNIHSEEKSF